MADPDRTARALLPKSPRSLVDSSLSSGIRGATPRKPGIAGVHTRRRAALSSGEFPGFDTALREPMPTTPGRCGRAAPRAGIPDEGIRLVDLLAPRASRHKRGNEWGRRGSPGSLEGMRHRRS